jgi:hypothetical protein
MDTLQQRQTSDYGSDYAHEPGAQKLQQEIDARQAELDKHTSTLEPKEGASHGDDGWSPEAIDRGKNVSFSRLMPDGSMKPMTAADGIDSLPRGHEVNVMTDKSGKLIDVVFGPDVPQAEKQRILDQLRKK